MYKLSWICPFWWLIPVRWISYFFPAFHNFSASLVVYTSTHSYVYIRHQRIFCILVLIHHACGSDISCSKALFPFSYADLYGYRDAWICLPMTSMYRHIFFSIFELVVYFSISSCYFCMIVMFIFIESLSLIILFALKFILPDGFLFFYFFVTHVLSYKRIFLYVLRLFFIWCEWNIWLFILSIDYLFSIF